MLRHTLQSRTAYTILVKLAELDVLYLQSNTIITIMLHKYLNVTFSPVRKERQSKGLLAIAFELGFHMPVNIKLEELKKILSQHEAFQNLSAQS
jgi:hypothetical protein